MKHRRKKGRGKNDQELLEITEQTVQKSSDTFVDMGW